MSDPRGADTLATGFVIGDSTTTSGGRTLASHGADVLLVTSPHLPNLPSEEIFTSPDPQRTKPLASSRSANASAR